MIREIRQAKDYLDYILQDDDTDFGGTSHIGETLENFIEEIELDGNTPIKDVNIALKQCGIKPIEY